jgi:predicted ATP-dependent Lon-type protease
MKSRYKVIDNLRKKANGNKDVYIAELENYIISLENENNDLIEVIEEQQKQLERLERLEKRK